MVTLPSDVVIVKEQLLKVGEKMGLSEVPSIVAMIETPAAALSAQAIGKYVDFLSFGTNDLTQYT
ncbi:phosphoenolpyruvate--protein phosphotransferase, partial [bacterium]|nr:phosphoenolpyruvate--protein phosphotransferase [bacterium]